MEINSALSGLSWILFSLVASTVLLAIAALAIEGIALSFIIIATQISIYIKKALAKFGGVVSARVPRKAKVTRIENGRKKFGKTAVSG